MNSKPAHFRRKLPVILCLGLLFANAGLASCGPQKLKTTELVIQRSDGKSVTLVVELAVTDQERAEGLMFRTKLPDGEGMLFLFERDEQLSFWMKNTLIPLSIAYISANGQITEIKDMYPQDETAVGSSRSVRYALEVPQGWFTRAGIQINDIVVIDF